MMPTVQSTFALILTVISDKEFKRCRLADVIYAIVMKHELIVRDGET